jgi:hypothetical protein
LADPKGEEHTTKKNRVEIISFPIQRGKYHGKCTYKRAGQENHGIFPIFLPLPDLLDAIIDSQCSQDQVDPVKICDPCSRGVQVHGIFEDPLKKYVQPGTFWNHLIGISVYLILQDVTSGTKSSQYPVHGVLVKEWIGCNKNQKHH